MTPTNVFLFLSTAVFMTRLESTAIKSVGFCSFSSLNNVINIKNDNEMCKMGIDVFSNLANVLKSFKFSGLQKSYGTLHC